MLCAAVGCRGVEAGFRTCYNALRREVHRPAQHQYAGSGPSLKREPRMVRHLLVRLAWLAAILALLALAPFPSDACPVGARHAAIAFAAVAGIGKILYDTLFYDHYWP